jgi:transcriptional regulator with XRE-family HTH domain
MNDMFALSEHYVKRKVRSRLDDFWGHMSDSSPMAKSDITQFDEGVDYAEPERSGPGHYLRGWRKRRKMTLQQLADEVGISKSHVSELESGDKVLSVKLLHRFSDALKVQAGFIVDLDPDTVTDEELERFGTPGILEGLDETQKSAVMGMIAAFKRA